MKKTAENAAGHQRRKGGSSSGGKPGTMECRTAQLVLMCSSGRVAACRSGWQHSLTLPSLRGNRPRHFPRRFISCVHIGSAIYFLSARRFCAIRYANRAKKIVTKAVEVRVERPPTTMHEALRDIRELKALYATLT